MQTVKQTNDVAPAEFSNVKAKNTEEKRETERLEIINKKAEFQQLWHSCATGSDNVQARWKY